jgi:hypothetical protein
MNRATCKPTHLAACELNTLLARHPFAFWHSLMQAYLLYSMGWAEGCEPLRHHPDD